MTSTALTMLRSFTGYKQFRFKCSKYVAVVGVKFLHIKTNANSSGDAVNNLLTTGNAAINIPSCGTFQAMPDDKSLIGKECWNWEFKNTGFDAERRIMDHSMYIAHTAHWNVAYGSARYECDSFENNVIGNGDFWKVYVK